MDDFRREIEAELEPGEQVLWATRPSIRHYVKRKMPMLLVMVGGAVALWVTSGDDIAAAVGQGGGNAPLILGAVAAATVLGWLAAVRLRLRTVYAITDRRLIRAGGQSRLSNRPGQTFSYRPHEVRFVEISNLAVWHHVYVDRVRWGDNRKTILVGFEDVADPPGVRDRIQAWLDAWQQRLLADMSDVRTVSNEAHGFRVELPASWQVEVGVAGSDQDVGPDQGSGSPGEWTPELRPWDDWDGGWDRMRATGPAGIVLAVEAIRGSLRGNGAEPSPTDERTLNRFFDMTRETEETEFAGRPATVTTWSAHQQTMRMIELRCRSSDFRIHLLAPAAMPRFMDALQTLASSFQLAESAAGVPAGSRGMAGSRPALPTSKEAP